MSKHSVVIVAGGSGTRMKSNLPKQFIEIAGKPVLVHTIEAFLRFDPSLEVILVLPSDHFETWERIHSHYFPGADILLAAGGTSRFQSVRSGLQLVSRELVAIHDAVRPCVTATVIKASFEAAEKFGSGLVTVPLKDSIREVEESESYARDRSRYRIVQTPQSFRTELIRKAFLQGELASFTDDATVFEAAGYQVTLVQGTYENIKITTSEDLKLVEVFLRNVL